MNTGLQDAHDLALLLADVAQGHLDPAALDRYERERRPVALRLVGVTDRLFGVVARRGPRTAWLRRRFGRVLALLGPRVTSGPLGVRLGGWLGQYRIRYHLVPPGAPVPGWADDPAVGLRLPPVGDNAACPAHLHLAAAHVRRPRGPAGPAGVGRRARRPRPDPAGRLRPDRAYLVRPDGFVVASVPVRDGVVDAASLSAALDANHVLR